MTRAEGAQQSEPGAGTQPCCVCTGPLIGTDRTFVWVDPGNNTLVAHTRAAERLAARILHGGLCVACHQSINLVPDQGHWSDGNCNWHREATDEVIREGLDCAQDFLEGLLEHLGMVAYYDPNAGRVSTRFVLDRIKDAQNVVAALIDGQEGVAQ